jgi:antitoxin (DNA-binding transcriptional repressor) of toxin-antitoxin stability system
MKTLTVTGLRKHISEIMDHVERGERIRVLRQGKAIADIVPADVREATPAWKRPGLRLVVKGESLTNAVLAERRASR